MTSDTTNHDLRVSARTARLTAATTDEDGPPWRFGGIAVAAGDILHMDDGTPVLMTAEELKKAADTQAGEPLSVDHPRDEDGRPQYPPPTEATAGKVAKADWVSSVEGVGYEATTHDEDIAKGVQGETYDVSIHPRFELGEKDPETGAHIARNIDFRDLSVVSKGDSPSNSAQWGPNQALASWTESADFDDLGDGTEAEEQRPVVRETVHGVLSALGLGRDELQARAEAAAEDSQADPEDAQSSDEPAEPGSEPEQTETDMTDPDETDPEEQEIESGEADEAEDAENDELEELRQRIDTLETELEAQQSGKADKVDEIIAESDDYDEDDREDLLASADGLIDQVHDQLTATQASQLPASGGLTTQAPSPAGLDDDDDLEDVAIGLADYDSED